jgi:CRISPR-associated protein Cmr3
LEHRVGVGLDVARRRAAEGRLFSLQAIAMIKRGHVLRQDSGSAVAADYDVGFVASVAGVTPPRSGLVRLGGDGRAAALHAVTASLPEPDYDAIARAHRCRLVLTSPGIFAEGWLPAGCTRLEDGSFRFELGGVQARLVCAAVPRFEVVSGWDLAHWQPKPAQRAAPAGSVYWLEDVEVTPEALRKLAGQGLWGEPCEDALRRAEGFNRITFAAY